MPVIQLTTPPKWWYRASPTCPARRTSPPYSPTLQLPVFGWLLCEPLSIDGCLRPWCISCLFIFCRSIRRPKRWNGVSPCALPPTRLRSNIPIIASSNSRLIVVCHHQTAATYVQSPAHLSVFWCVSFRRPKQANQPSRRQTRPWAWAPCVGPIRSSGAIGWWRQQPAHGVRGPMPLKGRAAAAHVGCCVLWLCFVLWLVMSTDFTHFVE
jgi:hypothetical protein